MAQAVSRWPFTAGPGFVSGSVHVGLVVDKAALGQVFPLSPLSMFHCGSPFSYIGGGKKNRQVCGRSSET
jgi:hypothetical protein